MGRRGVSTPSSRKQARYGRPAPHQAVDWPRLAGAWGSPRHARSASWPKPAPPLLPTQALRGALPARPLSGVRVQGSGRGARAARGARQRGTQPSTLALTLSPQPSTLSPQPSTLNPQPSTLNPQPSPTPRAGGVARHGVRRRAGLQPGRRAAHLAHCAPTAARRDATALAPQRVCRRHAVRHGTRYLVITPHRCASPACRAAPSASLRCAAPTRTLTPTLTPTLPLTLTLTLTTDP